jgi:hypothetical protein
MEGQRFLALLLGLSDSNAAAMTQNRTIGWLYWQKF